MSALDIASGYTKKSHVKSRTVCRATLGRQYRSKSSRLRTCHRGRVTSSRLESRMQPGRFQRMSKKCFTSRALTTCAPAANEAHRQTTEKAEARIGRRTPAEDPCEETAKPGRGGTDDVPCDDDVAAA